MRKNIAFVSSTRAEFGLLLPIMKLMESRPRLNLQLIVTGSHLSSQFGSTISEIERSGVPIFLKVDLDLKSLGPADTINCLSLAVSRIGHALIEANPDLLVVLGDRFEILGAVQAAVILGIPVAHIHGGEITEGAIDNAFRHAITKMAHFHFAANQEFRKRIVQMGEPPTNVWVSGAPGIDNIVKMKMMATREFEAALPGFRLGALNFLVTHHPVTLSKDHGLGELDELLLALDTFPEAKIIMTFPNYDTGGVKFIERIKEYCAQRTDRVYLVPSLGHELYLNALNQVDVVIGNSSSGLIEAPSFKVPTVNVGIRQKGRHCGPSIINVDGKSERISEGIRKALNPDFKAMIQGAPNPYGDGNAAAIIVDTIETLDLGRMQLKTFFEMEGDHER